MTKLDVLLLDQKPYYSPGDVLQGKCVLRIDDSLKFQTFYVELEGESYAHWTSSRDKETYHHTSRFPYFQLKQALLVSNDSTNNKPIILQGGTYEYPFAFQIPAGEIPSSFQSHTGHIRYWIKGKIVRSWAPDVKTIMEFPIYNPSVYNDLVRPIELAREKVLCCMCCESEPITINCSVDKSGYQVGECVLISARFRNPTDREMTPKAKLMTRITYYASGAQKVEETCLNKMADQPLVQDTDLNWDKKPLLIPSTINSINNCQNIRIEHFVKVTLDIPGSINVNIEYPIMIGRPPSHPNQYPYPMTPPTQLPPPNHNIAYPPTPVHPFDSNFHSNPLQPPPITMQPHPSAPNQEKLLPMKDENDLPSYSDLYASGSNEK